MGELLYHVTPYENYQRIIEIGLEPSTAPECNKSSGIHLAETVDAAYDWIARLREERDEYYYAEFAVLEVDVPDDFTIVADSHLAYGLEGVIACTTENIEPAHIGLYERL